MRTSILLLALLLSASLALAQRTRPAGQHEADKAETQFEKSIPPPAHSPQTSDFEKLRQNAAELRPWRSPFPRPSTKPLKEYCPKI